MRRTPWRVFLSHTSELQRFPTDRSFVDAAAAAVSAAGHVVVDTQLFAAVNARPADVCIDQVTSVDVYVGIIGFRYGSPVADRPERSYTELEFETATNHRLPCLVFLLDENAPLPVPFKELRDSDRARGERQDAFRRRLLESAGLTVVRVASPAELERRVYQALVELALQDAGSYAALEAQHRRLEIVNAVGPRVASSLDRWSVMRILREELANHLQFDLFTLAAVHETPDGPVAQGYVWDSGEERPVPPVPLASAGPSRKAYESGRPVLIRRAPWAHDLEIGRRSPGDRIVSQGVLIDVTRPGRHRRIVARSVIWVPVRHGEQTTALISLQSYRADAFDEWHARVLQDVASYVGLALANAEHFHAAQVARQRLKALYLLELGVAGAADEAGIAEAMSRALGSLLNAQILVLVYFDLRGRITSYCSEQGGPVRFLEPVEMGSLRYFARLLQNPTTIAEAVPVEWRHPLSDAGWPTWGPHIPDQILLVPLFDDNRVVGCISAQRVTGMAFTPEEIQFLENAAPVIGIALRTVRLHRANELALANSVRLQMVAGLAGHDLEEVLTAVAEQARNMMEAAGAACWAFDDEERVVAQAVAGAGQPSRILRWSGRTTVRPWSKPPRGPIAGVHRDVGWTIVPLWYGDRLVGALGAIHDASGVREGLAVVGDFILTAGIMIENAKLATETRSRIDTASSGA